MSEASANGAPEYSEENAPLLRKVIGQRLLESKLTIPHFRLPMSRRVISGCSARRVRQRLARCAMRASIASMPMASA